MTGAVPVLVMASMDLIARQSFATALLLDLPQAVVVSHDLEDGADGGGLRRVVTDRDGIRYDDRRSLQHACLSCAVREDLLPTLTQLAGDGRWRQVVVALPVSADPRTVVTLLHQEMGQGRCGPAELAGVVSLVDPATLVGDLFGDDLLAERGQALGAVDRRAVGEALVAQIESADLVATTSSAGGRTATLLQHLTRSPDRPRRWNELDGRELVRRRLGQATFQRRIDPLQMRPGATRTDPDVWTLDLTTSRAFHPDRLHERIEDLGRGAFRARGHFWLPTRPDTICLWDGAGGQLSIGTAGSWHPRRPTTRLVVTGLDPAERVRLTDAFDDVLLTATETAAVDGWTGRDDGFGPWLDEHATAA